MSLPSDTQTLLGWFNAIRAAKSQGRSSGVSVVTIRAICGENGDPISYHVESKKLSPVSQSRALIELIKEMSES